MDEVEANPDLIFNKIDAWLDGLFKLLPNIAVAIVVLFLFWLAARGLSALVVRTARNRERTSLAEVGGAMVKWMVMIAGVMLAITIIAPTISPGDLISGLGVSSVAIGFAFKDIFENFLAAWICFGHAVHKVDELIAGHCVCSAELTFGP